jgi:predicted branched-subunit amino acid permease
MTQPTHAAATAADYRHWFLQGIVGAVSVPGLILMSAFVGFAGLAREAGLTVYQAVFMTGMIWAVPAKVVLIGAIMSGASLPAAAFAVALSSVRLAPMVVALLPELRTEKTRTWVLLILSHFVAVTSWVLAMEKLRNIPRDMRTVYYGGLGGALVFANMVVVAIVYAVAGSLSPAVSAGLLLLTPIYFLTSLWGSARESASHFSMIFGLILGPLLHVYAPGFDLLLAGIIGGGTAFAIHKLRKARTRT